MPARTPPADNPTAIPFNVFKAETTNGDVLGGNTSETAAGFQPSGNSGIFYVIEIDAAQLPQGSPYVQVVINNGANADYGAVAAILERGPLYRRPEHLGNRVRLGSASTRAR